MLRRTLLIPASLSLSLVGGVGHAQDAETMTSTNEKALAALQAFQSKQDFKGRIRRSSAGSGGMGGVIIMDGSGGGGTKFDGPIEVHRSPEGDLIACSTKKLPGFEAWLGARRAVRTTFEDDSVDLADTLTELESLFSWEKLSQFAAKAEWKAEEKEGQTVFTGELGARLIPTASGPMGLSLGAKIMRVDTTVKLDASGNPKEVRFDVVRSDPMAAMRRRMMDGEFSGGSSVIEMSDLSTDEDELEEGETTSWILKVSDNGPSKRVMTFQKDISKIFEGEEF